VNGGAGLRRVSRLLQGGGEVAVGDQQQLVGRALLGAVVELLRRGDPLPADGVQARLEACGVAGEVAVDGPVLGGDEAADLVLAVADQAQRHRLDAAGGDPRGDVAPQRRGEPVAHDPVDRAAGLLGVHQAGVDPARVLEGLEDRVPRDLGEHDAVLLRRVDARHLGDVPGDRLPLPVEVGGEEDPLGFLGRLLDGGHVLAGSRRHLVAQRHVGLAHLDGEVAAGQVADMAVGGQDLVVLAEVLLDRLRLGRRLDDHEVRGHGWGSAPAGGWGPGRNAPGGSRYSHKYATAGSAATPVARDPVRRRPRTPATGPHEGGRTAPAGTAGRAGRGRTGRSCRPRSRSPASAGPRPCRGRSRGGPRHGAGGGRRAGG
jgi:hypothetical protein